jgi:heme oxygenase
LVKTRFQLKAATDDLHDELDRTMSRLDLARADDYRRFLIFHGRTVPAVESALDAHGLGKVLDGWPLSRRTNAIAADLSALGEPMPPPAPAPAIDGVGALLGTAYVLEGSRLGGQVLVERVGGGLPVEFLGSADAGVWARLVAALDHCLYSDPLIGEAKDAARRCFTLFLNVAREAGI